MTDISARPLKGSPHCHPGRVVPTFSDVRSTLREVRRVGKLHGHPLTRGSVEWAYDLAEMNERDRYK